jgi:SPP1 gp7 family putative phage head morphogenesis protein
VIEGSTKPEPEAPAPAPAADRQGDEVETRAYSPEIEDLLKLFQARTDKWLGQYGDAQVAKLRKIANGGRATVAENLRGILDDQFDPENLSDEAFDAMLLNEAEWAGKFDLAIRKVMRDVWAASLSEAHAEAGGALLKMSDKTVFEALSSQQINLTEGVASRLAERMRQVIGKNLAKAEGKAALRVLIKDELPALTEDLRVVFGTKEARASTIAHTEVASSKQAAKYAQYSASGVTKLRWMSRHDGAVRPSHLALDQVVVPIGTQFANGLRYPLDPRGEADQIINCRCDIVPAGRALPTEED